MPPESVSAEENNGLSEVADVAKVSLEAGAPRDGTPVHFEYVPTRTFDRMSALPLYELGF